jgi:hypothetical protein
MNVPKGYLGLSGLCPSGDGKCQFIVSQQHVEHLQRSGPQWKFNNLHVLPEILNDPSVIFEGLKRDDFEGGFCYGGHVSKRMQSTTIELPPPPEMVAVVFVRPRGRENIVLDWEWRPEHSDKPGWPESWDDDFERVKWSKT